MWDAASTEALLLSLRVSAVATVVMFVVGCPLALWIARRGGALSGGVEALLSLPLVIPPVVTGGLLLAVLSPAGPLGGQLAKLGLHFSLDWKGAAVSSAVIAFPLFLAIARVAFGKCDKGLEDAAKTLGAGPARAFFTITFPTALPGLAGAAALAFARAFGEFGATMMLAGNIPGQTRTVPQAIYSHLLSGRNSQAWALAAVSVAIGIAAMVVSRVLVRRQGRSGRNHENA